MSNDKQNSIDALLKNAKEKLINNNILILLLITKFFTSIKSHELKNK